MDGTLAPRLTMYTVDRGEHSRPSDFIQLCGASPSGPQRPNSAEYVLSPLLVSPAPSQPVGPRPYLPPIRGKYASISPLR